MKCVAPFNKRVNRYTVLLVFCSINRKDTVLHWKVDYNCRFHVLVRNFLKVSFDLLREVVALKY